MTGVGVVEVTAPLPSFDFATADRWELLVLCRGEPIVRLAFPSPGAVDSAELARALILPHAQRRLDELELEERLRARLGVPEPAPVPIPTCSVVLCTHGRPEHLTTALGALARLDPAPLEVVVVDNAPGERDCRAEVERHGFRYVREDRKGLDNARNAGARAAHGEVVAFTDDDVVHPRGWLQHLESSFADPLVAAVTGPAFAYVLDVPARVRMERQASLTRGLRRRAFDWTLISPLHGGQAGVGANMAVRASLLRAAHEPFPPELDAGTETRSGGDTYLFARLLAAGHRIVYEPRAYVFHQHRADWRALWDAVDGYGTGASAVLWKLLREDGELEAPRAGLWLLSQYLRTQRRRLWGSADAVETRIAWGYLHGAFGGRRAWRQERATQRAIDPALRPAAPFPPPTAAPLPAAPVDAVPPTAVASSEAPAISVVVPTVGRADVLARCLAALAAQTLPADAFEVVVVDDSPAGDAPIAPPPGLAARVHRSRGCGAAVARNEGAAQARGALVLFIDDDLIAAPDLLERHLAHHAQAPADAVVIGCSPPRPPRPGLAALGAALWWEDQFRMLEQAVALTFTEALSGNVSLARTAFVERWPFDVGFRGVRREDWEWGYRLLEGGAQLRYAPDALAAHEYELSAGARLRACRLEGRGDVLLATRHPQAAAALPLAHLRSTTWRRPLRRAFATLLGDPRADALVLPLLDLLERARLRGAWSALYRRAQRAAYAHGVRAGGWDGGAAATAPPSLDVELTGDEPLPPPGAVLPRLRVTHAGQVLAELQPREGWHPRVATRLAELLAGDPALAEPEAEPESPAPLQAAVTVVLGPGRAPGDARACDELEAAGARVVVLDGEPAAHWEQVLEAAAAAQTELVAIPLPGRTPTARWLAEVEVAFRAPRVALALGQGLRPTWAPEPLTLHERRRGRVPFAPLGGPADYLVLRAGALEPLRTAAAHAAYGPMAVAFACAEAVLAQGDLVAHRNAHGLDPSAGTWPTAQERERAKLAAWGALLADHALAAPGLRGPTRLAGITVAGAALGARRALRRGRPATAVTARESASALLRGYAAAFEGREPERAP